MAEKLSDSALDRRAFIAVTGLGAAALGACKGSASAEPSETASPPASGAAVATSSDRAQPHDPRVVRVASVKTAVEGSILPTLIAAFEKTTQLRVQVTTATTVYDLARHGSADLVISHYGHRDAEGFVLDGLGEWPRTIFSNQMALVGPPGDPAGVRGLDDAGLALRRIADTGNKFLVNDLDGVRYLTEILWNAAGCPPRAGWMIDDGAAGDGAMQRAAELGAYSLWGLTPFLRSSNEHPVALEPLVVSDPLLQRMLVAVVVKPKAAAHGVNVAGATAFQSFLLTPSTQAMIRTIHYPGKDAIAWVPAGRHNRTAILPKA